MFHNLPTTYADVHPQELRWALDLPAETALATLPVRHGDLLIELRILGTSHQVLVTEGDPAGGLASAETRSSGFHPSDPSWSGLRWSETVACGVAGDPIPDRVRRQRGGAHYLLTCTVQQLPSGEFERLVDNLVNELRDLPQSLVGAFPGDRRAITALALDNPAGVHTPEEAEPATSYDEGDLQWRSWHSYPQTGHLVTTQTQLHRSNVPDPVGGGAG